MVPNYPYKQLGTSLDRNYRNVLNQNFKDIEEDIKNAKIEVGDEVYKEVVDAAKLNWKEPLASQNNLPGNAQVGDTRMARDTGKVYRFNGSAWVEIQQIDAGPINEIDSRLTSQLAQTETKKADKEYVQEELKLRPSYAEVRLKSEQVGSSDVTQELLNFITGGSVDVLSIPKIKSTNPTQTTFFDKSSNLFDKSTVAPTVITDDGQGTESSSENYSTSRYELCEPGKIYRFKNISRVAWYDVDFNFINLAFVSNPPYTATAPDKSFFMRVSLQNGNVHKAQINLGKELLPYEEYYEKIDYEKYVKRTSPISNNELSPLSRFAVLLTNNKPNIDLHSGTLTLDPALYIHYGSNRYYKPSTEESITVQLHPVSNIQVVLFDTETEEFRCLPSHDHELFEETELVVMYLQFVNDASELKSAFSGCEITVNGIDYYTYLNGTQDTIGKSNVKFAPNIPHDFYTTNKPDAQGSMNADFDFRTTKSADVYAKYDSLIDKAPDYITKKLRGYDSSGRLPIHSLHLVPERVNYVGTNLRKKHPKFIFTCGIHGNSDVTPTGDPHMHIFSFYYFIEDIVKNWRDNKFLEYLRWNVEFSFIPIANPWGMDNQSRFNANGVDINRDFDSFSEVETQYIRDFINEEKDENVLCFLDYHCIGGNHFVADNVLMRHLVGENSSDIFTISENTIGQVSREWKGRARGFVNDLEFYGRIDVGDNIGTTREWVSSVPKIPSLTIESFRQTNKEAELGNGEFSEESVEMNVEHLGNWVMNVIRFFSKRNFKQ